MFAKILVVDDEPSIVDVLTRFLTREGYSVVTAANGREALERVQQEPPDLILLDVTMPELDGFSVCQRLKEDERTALIPITMLTGLDDREHRTRGIESGADDFLTKPFEQSILRARIRSQLRLKRLTDQLEHTEKVIFMLAAAVEAKDAYTEGHLRRLRAYSEHLALAYGLAPSEVRAVRYGGILHDIGKIGVDEAIIRKPGPLTPEETAQMRRHPEIGAQIISQMRFARDVQPIILAHHEYWDGSGYPRGLKDEEIPVGARIITIVDAYDAMTTDRPYRAALSDDEAIRRLKAARGTQFDPDMLDVFLDLIASGQLQPERIRAEVLHDGEL
ncbi:HD domain-containing phosphohydrolase [Kouleothrix sp.]|uniref:HD domain-containing phosphohydrolase n=1 Tax=Kouleothrix sp. TaxID=2779161 RepID=UPI00391B4DB4